MSVQFTNTLQQQVTQSKKELATKQSALVEQQNKLKTIDGQIRTAQANASSSTQQPVTDSQVQQAYGESNIYTAANNAQQILAELQAQKTGLQNEIIMGQAQVTQLEQDITQKEQQIQQAQVQAELQARAQEEAQQKQNVSGDNQSTEQPVKNDRLNRAQTQAKQIFGRDLPESTRTAKNDLGEDVFIATVGEGDYAEEVVGYNVSDLLQRYDAANQTTVVVQSGESLQTLADKYGVTTQQLIEANPQLLQSYEVKNEFGESTGKTIKGFAGGAEIKVPKKLNPELLKDNLSVKEAKAETNKQVQAEQNTQSANREARTEAEKQENLRLANEAIDNAMQELDDAFEDITAKFEDCIAHEGASGFISDAVSHIWNNALGEKLGIATGNTESDVRGKLEQLEAKMNELKELRNTDPEKFATEYKNMADSMNEMDSKVTDYINSQETGKTYVKKTITGATMVAGVALTIATGGGAAPLAASIALGALSGGVTLADSYAENDGHITADAAISAALDVVTSGKGTLVTKAGSKVANMAMKSGVVEKVVTKGAESLAKLASSKGGTVALKVVETNISRISKEFGVETGKTAITDSLLDAISSGDRAQIAHCIKLPDGSEVTDAMIDAILNANYS